ncbi:MAG: ABC transporter ATP-binding protein, partial [Candidatus Puniceispirillaceae bacterium]
MPDRVLEVKNLSVDIPLAEGVLHAVDDLNIHVDKGETLCIVGESGCGKSLTSLAIMDLLPKKEIRRLRQLDLAGTSILDYSEKQMSDIRGNKMGMIFQEPMTSLNPAFTIGNQMIETLHRHRTISGDEARDLAKRMLEKVGITAADQRLGQYPHQLSGGLRQRVMIAMTLLCEPELIIADEPTTALDVTIQAQILLLLKDLQNEFDMGLMLITHDLGVVARIATRVAVMYAGQIVEQGTAQQIFENPLHPYTRGLMRCIPVPGKTKRGTPLGSIPGMVPSLIGEFTGCRIADS